MADVDMTAVEAAVEAGNVLSRSSGDLTHTILSLDMDETGVVTPLLEHEDFDWVRALLEREEVRRAQNPSASGDEDTASMELHAPLGTVVVATQVPGPGVAGGPMHLPGRCCGGCAGAMY